MTATTTEPLTRAAIDQFLSQLTDEDKLYALVKLFRPVLAPIKEKRAIYDESGKLLGDYVPMPKVQPGQKMGMSDEAREAISKMKCMTREQWKAEKARLNAAPSEPNT